MADCPPLTRPVLTGYICEDCARSDLPASMVSVCGQTARPLCDGCAAKVLSRALGGDADDYQAARKKGREYSESMERLREWAFEQDNKWARDMRAGMAQAIRHWARDHAPNEPGAPLEATLGDMLELADMIERGEEPPLPANSFLKITHSE